MSTVRAHRVGLTLTTPTTVRVHQLTASAAHTATTVRAHRITITAARPVEPYDTITLPAGDWTQTSGPTITITDGQFTVPATIDGADIALTDGARTIRYHALPHTLWMKAVDSLVPLRI